MGRSHETIGAVPRDNWDGPTRQLGWPQETIGTVPRDNWSSHAKVRVTNSIGFEHNLTGDASRYTHRGSLLSDHRSRVAEDGDMMVVLLGGRGTQKHDDQGASRA